MTTSRKSVPFYVASEIDQETSKAGHKLFAKNIEFVKGIKSASAMPSEGYPEVCFSGRSNVGKSSLINALTGRKSIARTSKTPGRTREINFFLLDQNKFLIDLPGYGFARVPLSEKNQWGELVKDYFFFSQNLRRVFLLIDSRHGIRSSDITLMELLGDAGVIFQVVFTKFDKVKSQDFKDVLELSFNKMAHHANAYPEVLITSSQKKHGLEKLRGTICKLLSPS